MDDYQSLSHTRWECKYHVVFIPKCRRKVLYGHIRKELGKVLAELARHKESQIDTGSLQPDHVHMVISIPPKHSVAQVIGYIKGKSAIHLAREFFGRKKLLWDGENMRITNLEEANQFVGRTYREGFAV